MDGREDGISKPCPLFVKKQKEAMHQKTVVLIGTTKAKCQQQLADTVVGEERGNLLFNGL